MSYILEALKKSQQERSRRGKVPDIQTLHQSVSSAEIAAPPSWPYWALGVCLLVMAFMLGWLQPWVSRIEVAPVVVVEPINDRKPNRATVALPEKKVTQPSVVTPVKAAAVSSAGVNLRSVEQITDISQLPSLVQQSIPQMQFAGHVYSDNPVQRSVIINGRYMSEGDSLMQGMTLVRITLDSVVFSYQAQLFKVTVLHDWALK